MKNLPYNLAFSIYRWLSYISDVVFHEKPQKDIVIITLLVDRLLFGILRYFDSLMKIMSNKWGADNVILYWQI